jgi:hypothetical protein
VECNATGKHINVRTLSFLEWLVQKGTSLGFVVEREYPLLKGTYYADVAWKLSRNSSPLVTFEVETKDSVRIFKNVLKYFGPSSEKIAKPWHHFLIVMNGRLSEGNKSGMHNLIHQYNIHLYEDVSERTDVLSILEGVLNGFYLPGSRDYMRLTRQKEIGQKLQEQEFLPSRISEIRNELIVMSPEKLNLSAKIVGTMLLYPNLIFEPTITSSIIGVAGASRKMLLRVGGFAGFYLGYITAASLFVLVNRNRIINESRPSFMPDLRRVKNNGLPFTEMFSEFPQLRKIGYGLILHYLTELTILRLCMRTMKKFQRTEFIFRFGSWVPHGFYSVFSEVDSTLKKLKLEFLETFDAFCDQAKNYEITPVSVAINQRDIWFAENVCRKLLGDVGSRIFMDYLLLAVIMQEKDVTCLFQRDELARKLNLYEFYMKSHNTLSKCEFLNLNKRDPFKLQERIAKIVHVSSISYPRATNFLTNLKKKSRKAQGVTAPSMCVMARENALFRLRRIELKTKAAFEYGLEKLEDELKEGFRHNQE